MINCTAAQTEEYYNIAFPRLHTLNIVALNSIDIKSRPTTQPFHKVQFARLNPSVRKLSNDYFDKHRLPKEFWEVVETERKDLESSRLSGTIEVDAVDSFWRICDRAQGLYFNGMQFPENLPILETLSFQRLRDLTVKRASKRKDICQLTWPLQLLQQVKGSTGLRRLEWRVEDLEFPFPMVLEALVEGCWPDWCELSIGGWTCSDQGLANILRALTSGRLTHLALSSRSLGSLTFDCLRGLYFRHLRDLHFGYNAEVPSEMVQEILTECVNLVKLDASHIFVRDIATSPKPWGCLGSRSWWFILPSSRLLRSAGTV